MLDAIGSQRIARRRLSSKLRPLMLRRLKQRVAKDLPDRIEERRDCHLGEEQRKLYLAELRRSRDQVMQAVAKEGLNKSKMPVLAALTLTVHHDAATAQIFARIPFFRPSAPR